MCVVLQFLVIAYSVQTQCHATDQAQEFLGKPANENKAVEFRLESGDSMVSSSKFMNEIFIRQDDVFNMCSTCPKFARA